MLDLDTARATALTGFGGLVDRLERTRDADFDAPIRLQGWRVRDLAAHVAWGQAMEADALTKMLAGSSEPATAPAIDAGRGSAELVEAARAAHTSLRAAFDALTPENVSGACPLPYATVPGSFAIQIFAMEGGVHRNDLTAALDRSEPLSPAVIQAAAFVMTQSLPMLAAAATDRPAPGTAFHLRGDAVDILASYDGSGWTVGAGGDRSAVEVAGDDSSLVLFLLGRIPADDPALKGADAAGLAARFKEYIPGP